MPNKSSSAWPSCRARVEENNGVSISDSMTKKKTGVRKMPNSVTPSIPLKTAVPSDLRISAPAPDAVNSGTTPRMKANDVIKIGRSRS